MTGSIMANWRQKSTTVELPMGETARTISKFLNSYIDDGSYSARWLKRVSIASLSSEIIVSGRDNPGRFHTCRAEFTCSDSGEGSRYAPIGTVVDALYCDCYWVADVVDSTFRYLERVETNARRMYLHRL
jgi:hypothetical protein